MVFNGVVIAAVVVIVSLSVIAAYYVLKLRRRNAGIKKQLDEQNAMLLNQQKERHRSIVFLANALLQGQLSSTEASMRISWLARTLELSPTQQESVLSFDKLAESTQHIPILEEWKKLPKKQQFMFDKQRLSLEKEYDDFLMASAQKIVETNFL